MPTPTVQVRLPGLLSSITSDDREITLDALTVDEALERLVASYPGLEPHLFTDAGELRPHLELFVNDTNVEWLPDDQVFLEPGDTVIVFQAVSGG